MLRGILRRLDNRVKVCDDLTELRHQIAEGDWNILICDVRIWIDSQADGDIISLALGHSLPVAVTASYAMMPLAESAVAAGAFVSLMKPLRADEVIAALNEAPDNDVLVKESPAPELCEVEKHFGYLIGEDSSMHELYTQISRVAATDMTVLIRGESGTGKELAAKSIHGESSRSSRPFVAVNCASLSDQLLESELFGHVKGAFTGAIRNKEGLFQVANGGTLFLDEIGSVSVNMQQALLRVLEDKKVRPVGGTESITVNTRVIAATNENLEDRISDGRFRLDLFHRLSVLPLQLPPLRGRKSDISLLAGYFLRKIGSKARLSVEAVRLLEGFDWPGNIRQLENVIMRAVAMSPEETELIGASDLPGELRESVQAQSDESACMEGELPANLTLKAYLRACERHYLKVVLDNNGGDKEAAARSLGISLATFYRKFEEA